MSFLCPFYLLMLCKQASVGYCNYTPDVWECSLRELNRAVWSLYFCQNYRLWGNFVLCCRNRPQSCAPRFSPVPDSCSVAQLPNSYASTSLNFHLRETRTTPNLLSCPFSTRFTRYTLFLSSPPWAQLPPASGPAAGAGRARPGPARPPRSHGGRAGAGCPPPAPAPAGGVSRGRAPEGAPGAQPLAPGSPPVPGRWRGRLAPPEARSRRGRRVAASGCGCWGRGWEAPGQGHVGGCALKPDFCVFFFYLGVGARVTATHIPEVRLNLYLWHSRQQTVQSMREAGKQPVVWQLEVHKHKNNHIIMHIFVGEGSCVSPSATASTSGLPSPHWQATRSCGFCWSCHHLNHLHVCICGEKRVSATLGINRSAVNKKELCTKVYVIWGSGISSGFLCRQTRECGFYQSGFGSEQEELCWWQVPLEELLVALAVGCPAE